MSEETKRALRALRDAAIAAASGVAYRTVTAQTGSPELGEAARTVATDLSDFLLTTVLWGGVGGGVSLGLRWALGKVKDRF